MRYASATCDMLDSLKRLGKDSLVYGLGGILAKSVGLIVLPVYTRLLQPAQYGDIELLAVLGTFFGALLAMGMDSAQSFFFYEQQNGGRDAQARVVSAIAQWRITWGLVLVAIATAVSPLLNGAFFQSRLTWTYFLIIFAANWLGQMAAQSSDVFRLQHMPWHYIRVTLTNTLLTALTGILFVAVFDLGVLGWLLGTVTGSLLAATVGWWGIRAFVRFDRWHRDWWPRLLKFGFPFVPAALAMYFLTSTDRWLIGYYHGPSALGGYAVGAKFATLITAAVVTFRQAWWPVAMSSLQTEEGPRLLRFMARAYLGLAAVGVVVLTAIAPGLVRLVTAPAYHPSYRLVGILAWPAALYGFYAIVAAGVWKREQTFWLPAVMTVAAVGNVALGFFLVPRYGAFGAAIATALSFFVWNVLTLAISERLWPIGHSFLMLGLQLGAGAGATAAILLLQLQGGSAWAIAGVALAAIAAIAAASVDRGAASLAISLFRRRFARVPQS